jgi:hypothetical protein
MKNVGRVNRGSRSQFPCDRFLDNTRSMSKIALQVAAKIASYDMTLNDSKLFPEAFWTHNKSTVYLYVPQEHVNIPRCPHPTPSLSYRGNHLH